MRSRHSRTASLPANDFGASFDPGPPHTWETLFEQAPVDAYCQHATGHFHCSFGPVFYRGRLNGTARVLVIGQDPSIDELFARRVLVGRSGQRVQGFLHKLGITRAYVMVNTFLFGVRHEFDKALRAIALQPGVLDFRNSMLNKIVRSNRLEGIVVMGEAAQFAVQHWPGFDASRIPVVSMAHPTLELHTEREIVQNWNVALGKLRALITPEDVVDTAYYGEHFAPEVMAPIPRIDLPFGMPDWLGTAGTHGVRTRTNRIVWTEEKDEKDKTSAI